MDVLDGGVNSWTCRVTCACRCGAERQVGDLPDADIAPPDNVLFVCKLNPHTTDEDLETIFSRFGEIVWYERSVFYI